MPWEVLPVSELRLAFVHHVVSLKVPVSEACTKFNISRKTAYKWLRRYREQGGQPLVNRSRRPLASPARTAIDIEQRVLQVRGQFGWGRARSMPICNARTLPCRAFAPWETSSAATAAARRRLRCLASCNVSSAWRRTSSGSAITKDRWRSPGARSIPSPSWTTIRAIWWPCGPAWI